MFWLNQFSMNEVRETGGARIANVSANSADRLEYGHFLFGQVHDISHIGNEFAVAEDGFQLVLLGVLGVDLEMLILLGDSSQCIYESIDLFGCNMRVNEEEDTFLGIFFRVNLILRLEDV